MAETNSLLNCRTRIRVPGVRIPLSPQKFGPCELGMKGTGYSVVRLSRHIWDVEAAGSNPATPTLISEPSQLVLFYWVGLVAQLDRATAF